MNENQKQRKKRVWAAAESALFEKGYASCIDILMKLEMLTPAALDDWRKGRVRDLERVMQGNLNKISETLYYFRQWSRERDLKPSETVYHQWNNGPRRDLRFSKSGSPTIERLYRTHYVSPKLLAKKPAGESGKRPGCPAPVCPSPEPPALPAGPSHES